MAREPIQFFGRFQPTGVDTSAADRLKAIVGRADEVGELAVSIGQANANSNARKDAVAAVQKAKTIDESGKTTYDTIEKRNAFLWGAEQFNRVVESEYVNGVTADAFKIINENARKYDRDSQLFEQNTQIALDALTANIPPELQPSIQQTLYLAKEQKYSTIFNKQRTETEKKAAASALDNLGEVKKTIEEAVRNGKTAQALGLLGWNAEKGTWNTDGPLEDIRLYEGLGYIKKGTAQAVIDNFNFDAYSVTQIADFEQQLQPQGDETEADMIQRVKAFIDNRKKVRFTEQMQDTLKGDDSTIPVTKEETADITKQMEERLTRYKTERKAEIDKNRLEDRLANQATYDGLISNVLSDDGDISELQTLSEQKDYLDKMEFNQKITGEQKSNLQTYLSRKYDESNLENNSLVAGEILSAIALVNADYEKSFDSEVYLKNVQAIEEDILTREEITSTQRYKLYNQLKTLTAAKEAGALIEFSSTLQDGLNLIQNQNLAPIDQSEILVNTFNQFDKEQNEIPMDTENRDKALSNLYNQILYRQLINQQNYNVDQANKVLDELARQEIPDAVGTGLGAAEQERNRLEAQKDVEREREAFKAEFRQNKESDESKVETVVTPSGNTFTVKTVAE
jgi:hypothetical protein